MEYPFFLPEKQDDFAGENVLLSVQKGHIMKNK